MLLIFSLFAIDVIAQSEPHVVEPKTIDIDGHVPDKKDPPEAASGKSGDGNSKETKPGKDIVSTKAKNVVADIKSINSFTGGDLKTEAQRAEIVRQLENERIIAASEGRRADAEYIAKEKDKIQKMKLYVEGSESPESPKPKKPRQDRSRNDTGAH